MASGVFPTFSPHHIAETPKISKFFKRDYDSKYGFSQKVDSFTIPKGLSEDTISQLKWSDNDYPKIAFQNMSYYSEPKKKPTLNSLSEVDAEVIKTFDNLGIPLTEQKRLANVAVYAVFDSVSIATTHSKSLSKSGVNFCSISDAIKTHPDLIKKYLGKVVPPDDNFFAALNSAVFTDGTFVCIPKNTKRPMQISTYFRINAMETGQFKRTLIIADDIEFRDITIQPINKLKTKLHPKPDENSTI
ncbi:hypothetical protein LXL04_030911 [Taraxacum kok-saghyz]